MAFRGWKYLIRGRLNDRLSAAQQRLSLVFLRYQHPNFAGDLQSRLKAFNLDEHFTRYPLLVKFDWLRPAFHVPVPEAWFLNWKNYPVHPVNAAIAVAHWAEMNDGRWFISESEIGTDEWFVHPLVRRGSTRLNFFDKATTNHEDFSWETLLHPRGVEFVPAFDYFYEWQLFRFADVVHWMEGAHPHFWRPGAYQNLVRYANESVVADFDKPPIMPKWTARADAFTWLAHFIAFREAFDHYAIGLASAHKRLGIESHDELEKKLIKEKRAGATQLMVWLGTTPASLEHALRHELLTLAQHWRWRKYHETASKLALWRALQSHVRAAIDWLSLVNENGPIDYLEKLRYDHNGQDDWAPLEEVLEYPLWKAARCVSQFVKGTAERYAQTSSGFAVGYAPSPVELTEMGTELEAFDSYLDALWRLIEESSHKGGDDPFRPRSRASWYRVIAIIGFMLLEDAMVSHKRKMKQPMQAVAEHLAGKGDEWGKFQNRPRVKTEQAMADIADGIRNATTKEDLILYFSLAVHHARNSTAHPYGVERDWLEADWAGPIFDALVLFVPWALVELRTKR